MFLCGKPNRIQAFSTKRTNIRLQRSRLSCGQNLVRSWFTDFSKLIEKIEYWEPSFRRIFRVDL